MHCFTLNAAITSKFHSFLRHPNPNNSPFSFLFFSSKQSSLLTFSRKYDGNRLYRQLQLALRLWLNRRRRLHGGAAGHHLLQLAIAGLVEFDCSFGDSEGLIETGSRKRLGVVRLQVQVRSGGSIPSKISLRWESWRDMVTLWPEAGPTFETVRQTVEMRGGASKQKEGRIWRREERRISSTQCVTGRYGRYDIVMAATTADTADTLVNLNHVAKARVTRGAYRRNRYVTPHFETLGVAQMGPYQGEAMVRRGKVGAQVPMGHANDVLRRLGVGGRGMGPNSSGQNQTKRVTIGPMQIRAQLNSSVKWVFGSLRDGIGSTPSMELHSPALGSESGQLASEDWQVCSPICTSTQAVGRNTPSRLIREEIKGDTVNIEQGRSEVLLELRWANSGDELALVVWPKVIVDGASGLPYPEPDPKSELGADFCMDQLPSLDEVSDWVLDHISEVSKFLGVSFEGHEDEALKLFSAIEASWTGGGVGGLKSESCSASGSKACREKLRRDKLNERFLELGSVLEHGKPPKTDKAAILSDAVRMVTQLRSEARKLRESNEDLHEKIKELKAEKNELRDEKQRLKEDKEKLEQQVKAMSAQPGFLPHPSAVPAASQGQAAGNKLMPFIGYPGVAMWQFIPSAVRDTSQDHVLRPPVA
ncbi:unnamed protein product [Camellia sinensis]